MQERGAVITWSATKQLLPLNLQYQNINSYFLSHIFRTDSSCAEKLLYPADEFILSDRAPAWLNLSTTRRNLYLFLSCSLLEIERRFREEIVNSIFYNLYTKRNIKKQISSWSSLYIAFLGLDCEFSCELWIFITVVGLSCRLGAILQVLPTEGAHWIVWIPYIIRLEQLCKILY